MNKINLIGLLLLTTTLSVFANTNETVKSNLFINQFETSNVSAIPSIETQPESTLCVGLGDAIALSIVASPGNGTVSYQWQKGETPIPNANSLIFEKTNVQIEDNGTYTIVIQNYFGEDSMAVNVLVSQ